MIRRFNTQWRVVLLVLLYATAALIGAGVVINPVLISVIPISNETSKTTYLRNVDDSTDVRRSRELSDDIRPNYGSAFVVVTRSDSLELFHQSAGCIARVVRDHSEVVVDDGWQMDELGNRSVGDVRKAIARVLSSDSSSPQFDATKMRTSDGFLRMPLYPQSAVVGFVWPGMLRLFGCIALSTFPFAMLVGHFHHRILATSSD